MAVCDRVTESVRIYVIWPFSYSRCAVDIVYLAEKPSLRDASCCNVVVRNGAYGERRYGLRSTLLTVKGTPVSRSARPGADIRCTTPAGEWPLAAALASSAGAAPSRYSRSELRSSPAELKSRPCATRRPSTAASLPGKEEASSLTGVKIASRSQYAAGRNAIRSRSLATTSRVATDWTRPADSRGMTFFHRTGETSYP